MTKSQLGLNNTEMNDVLTVRDAAAYLYLHPKTVCAYIRDGKLRAIRCGRYYRIRRDWLLDFFENEPPSGDAK